METFKKKENVEKLRMIYLEIRRDRDKCKGMRSEVSHCEPSDSLNGAHSACPFHLLRIKERFKLRNRFGKTKTPSLSLAPL